MQHRKFWFDPAAITQAVRTAVPLRQMATAARRLSILLAMLTWFSPMAAATQKFPAPAAEVSIQNSYKHAFVASNGVSYDLTVFLPKRYDPEKSDRYPVFYFIPGDGFEIFFSQVISFLSAGDIQKMILVSVDLSDDAYFKDLPSAGHDPHFDVPSERGAGNFLKILTTEIKPWVDTQFPTDPHDTGIGGHSLGGFFALYAFLHQPETFRHVYASSPSLVWQDFILLRYEADLAARVKDVDASVVVDQGGLEGDDGRLEQLSRAITGRGYPSLRWKAERVPGQTHQTIALANGLNALYAIYGPTLRTAPADELNKLAGTYLASDGSKFAINVDAGKPYLVGFSHSDGGRLELQSSEPNRWFVRYLEWRFDVVPATRGPTKLTIQLESTPGPNGAPTTPKLSATRVERRTSPHGRSERPAATRRGCRIGIHATAARRVARSVSAPPTTRDSATALPVHRSGTR